MVNSLDELVLKVYPNIEENFANSEWFKERVLLATRNDTVIMDININIQERVPGNAVTYYSVDTVMDQHLAVMYPVEFLNRLEIPGFPSHKIDLKVGSPIIILRNINPPLLCNGTRLRVMAILCRSQGINFLLFLMSRMIKSRIV